MKSAFIFGHAGNLKDALGSGWSVEDSYAWAVGYESKLTLALPGNSTPYVVRFVLHPLINPGVRDAQRVIFKGGDDVLARFSVADRQAVEFPLPPELTAGARSVELTVMHPDALRPADFQPSTDTRWLTLCFHSAGLIEGDGAAGDTEGAGNGSHPPMVAIAGNSVAQQLVRIASAMPCLRNRVAFRYVDTMTDLATADPEWAPNIVGRATALWLQMGTGRTATVEALHAARSAGAAVRRFGVPDMGALWPFLSADPRAVEEGELYRPARYRFGDRIAGGIASAGLSDALLFERYETSAAREMPDLDALLANDIAAWERMDERCDIGIAAFVADECRRQRLFLAPSVPGPALLRALAERLLALPLPECDVALAELAGDLDTVMEGYRGPREELPVHPAVASHFGLAWWHPDLTYRWFGNRLSFRDYTLGYMRWAAWRP